MHDMFSTASMFLFPQAPLYQAAPQLPPFPLPHAPTLKTTLIKTSNLGARIFIFLSNPEHKAHRHHRLRRRARQMLARLPCQD